MGWKRIKVPGILPKITQGYQKEVHDGHLSVFVVEEAEGFHMSISHRLSDGSKKPGRYPTWDEIHDARYRFCPLDKTMVMHLPPQEEYVNLHATTFHLWELKNVETDG